MPDRWVVMADERFWDGMRLGWSCLFSHAALYSHRDACSERDLIRDKGWDYGYVQLSIAPAEKCEHEAKLRETRNIIYGDS